MLLLLLLLLLGSACRPRLRAISATLLHRWRHPSSADEDEGEDARGTDGHDDDCAVCGSDTGRLMLCDGCPRSFHVACAGLPALPPGASLPGGGLLCLLRTGVLVGSATARGPGMRVPGLYSHRLGLSGCRRLAVPRMRAAAAAAGTLAALGLAQ